MRPTGELGAAFVRGLQGDHPTYLKAAACAKHYAVHSGPEKGRHSFDAIVSKRDLHDTYLPAFKKLVTEAHVEAVMGAYNRINGEPCCASRLLLGDILRGAWGFTGHVVSDCGALSDIHNHHHVTRDGVRVPFEQVEAEARQRASAERLRTTIDQWTRDLRARSEVVIVAPEIK